MLPLFVCHVDIQRQSQTTRSSVAWARNKHTETLFWCIHVFGTPHRKVNTCIGQGSTRMLMTHYATQSILRYSVVHRDQCCSVWMHNSKTKTHCDNHWSNYFTTRENISNQTGVLHYSNNSSSKEQLFSKRRIILPVMKSQALTRVNCLPQGIPARQEQSLGAGREVTQFFWMCLSCMEKWLVQLVQKWSLTSTTTAQNHWCASQMAYSTLGL